MQTDPSTIYSPTSLAKRISSISITTRPENPEYVVNRLSQKYDDSYQGLMHRRRRLSSTGDGSGDSSTTASGSSYGEREEGSEGRAESDEMMEERKPPEGMVTEAERQQVETFFRGLKTQVGNRRALPRNWKTSILKAL